MFTLIIMIPWSLGKEVHLRRIFEKLHCVDGFKAMDLNKGDHQRNGDKEDDQWLSTGVLQR